MRRPNRHFVPSATATPHLEATVQAMVKAAIPTPTPVHFPTCIGCDYPSPASRLPVPARPDLYEIVEPPEHMASVWWRWGPEQDADGFEKLLFPFTIWNDVQPQEDSGLYLMLCSAYMEDTGFYFGLQSSVQDGSPPHGWLGKAVLFSRWGTLDLSHARTDGFTQSSGYEGDFIGVRLLYERGPGHYVAQFAPDGENSEGRWFGLWVTDIEDNETTWIGSLKVSPCLPRGRALLLDCRNLWQATASHRHIRLARQHGSACWRRRARYSGLHGVRPLQRGDAERRHLLRRRDAHTRLGELPNGQSRPGTSSLENGTKKLYESPRGGPSAGPRRRVAQRAHPRRLERGPQLPQRTQEVGTMGGMMIFGIGLAVAGLSLALFFDVAAFLFIAAGDSHSCGRRGSRSVRRRTAEGVGTGSARSWHRRCRHGRAYEFPTRSLGRAMVNTVRRNDHGR